jgi:uncharacterized phage protein (TIGR02220 family)
MAHLKVKGWADFQHYKDRSPPWIKLHKTLLDNFEYQSLPIASKALAPMLWLLASESDGGVIDACTKKLAFRLRTSEQDIIDGLIPLIDNGFFIDDSDVLADCKQSAMPETETETEVDIEAKASMSGKPDDAQPNSEKPESTKSESIEVLQFLNTKASRNYRPTDVNLQLIKARLKEGYTAQDCKQVIAKKCREWLPDDKMREYLRPATLFNREKFNQYIGEIVEEA